MAQEEGAIQLSVTPGQVDEGSAADLTALVSVRTPGGKEQVPVDICCVIDISWSMSMEAKVQTAGGAVESNGLSMLDVAKHAARTIVRTLGPKDRVSFVTFCREAVLVLPLTEMTEEGQSTAEARLKEVSFGNGTNLWEGIRLAFDSLRAGASPDRLAHVMLLTDGTTEHKAEVMPKLQAERAKHDRLPCTINAFGFGYEIDSELLVQIAEFSDGTYSFIPDAGFVGTIFVNCMSNLLVTMARDSVLRLEAGEDTSSLQVLGGWQQAATREGDALVIQLGTLQYGQTKDVVVQMSVKASGKPFLVATLETSRPTPKGMQVQKMRAEGIAPDNPKESQLVETNVCRSIFVDTLARVAAKARAGGELGSEASIKEAAAGLQEGASKISASAAANAEPIVALLEDMMGQCHEALSRLDYYSKWGRHYLPSLTLAHKLQQCNNFKDPGVQVYGGDLFEKTRDKADSVFDSMPAPEITPAMYRYLGNNEVIRNPTYLASRTGEGAALAPPVTMAAYNDRYAGCIDGASQAWLATGESRRVADLRKGDRVLTGSMDSAEAEAEVLCVVRSRCSGGRAALVELAGGARLTPYHPVLRDGVWQFPAELSEIQEQSCEAIYSFVLRGAPCLLVGSTPCVALRHGLEEGAAKHPYLGSERVLQDLARLPGHGAGLVELAAVGGLLRD
eukprot:CAMPEP_0195142622 /NCGR_PEP_ID=MMETSP0448-20130528/164930_1 /TAXON_ID=66468 /ORGANISM="Heterocapsa triquestra, Strain CCMP 448" /LENGTH=676 /DNA_ID=CAMNT_0040181025 /DNA_START=101 /DNA_END=2128 /DNA_ORIENTATION=+